MIGFKNIAVHDYQPLELILEAILHKHIDEGYRPTRTISFNLAKAFIGAPPIAYRLGFLLTDKIRRDNE